MNGRRDKGQETGLPILPPPPPFSSALFSPISQNTKLLNCTTGDKVLSFEEAIKRIADVEGCFHQKPFYSVNNNLQSQLQEGPKCGLVALSIATSVTDNFKSPDELFDEAVKRGFTTQGEMYSTENLATLVEGSTKFKAFVLDSGINSHIDCIFQCIQNGGLMLIPYDADYNHSPCCRRGHNAHWAVMSGIVIFKLKASEENDCVSDEEDASVTINSDLYSFCQCLKSDSNKFFKMRPDKIKILRRASDIYFTKNEKELRNAKKCKLYLAGKQGKSKHLALWPFEVLAESNNNLVELSEQQRTKNFALPIGGISSGLKGKAILLNL